MIQIRINDPRSLGSSCIRGTDESLARVDSSVPLMHHGPDLDYPKETHPGNTQRKCNLLKNVDSVEASETPTFKFNFNFIYYLTKENTNGRFPQIALASRGGKRQKREGRHNSSSNLNKIQENKIEGSH